MKKFSHVLFAMVVGLVTASQSVLAAPLFEEDFEGFGIGDTVFAEGGASGAPVSASAQSSLTTGDQGILLGSSGINTARKNTLTQTTAGDYRFQFDAASFSASAAGSTSNQLFFARWGGNTNINLTLVSQGTGNTTYDLKYSNGSTFVDTGLDLADDQWAEYRVEWNTGSSTVQRLYVDDNLIFTGQLIYGTVANPTSLSFVQFVSNNATQGFDNVFFGTGTGDFTPIPEPASLTLLALGGMLMLKRKY